MLLLLTALSRNVVPLKSCKQKREKKKQQLNIVRSRYFLITLAFTRTHNHQPAAYERLHQNRSEEKNNVELKIEQANNLLENK